MTTLDHVTHSESLSEAQLDQVSGGTTPGGQQLQQTEPTLSIGSQSTGAGAGKVTFNPFSITRKVDRSSPVFF
jgi:type VI protein secretion system component Hcp